ncbi:MAG: Beta-galactosidase [Phycisphaerae bacterium]|nr:Beta-galactosidase [Phycisphaerae bacterium]
MASLGRDILPDLFVSPDFDDSSVRVTFTRPRDVRGCDWKIVADGKRVAGGRVPAGGRGRVVEFTAKLPGFAPWTIDAPFLYRLTLTLSSGGGSRRVVQDFGMRKVHAAGNQLYLNNKPFYVRGVIRGREAHDHANLLGLPEEEYYAKFIRAAKKLGFNFIRFHSRVPSEAYFDAADRLGVLTHVEVRKYFGKYQAERELMDHDPTLVRRKDWVDAIKRIRNHPSLMVYCLGNEINKPGRNPEVAERAAQLRRLDDTRLFIDTCARGEPDRDGVDLDVQHMGYFAPFGTHYDMFDTSANWAIFGSVADKEMVARSDGAATAREVPVRYPVVAHEVGHYINLRDLDALKRKFKSARARAAAEEPWWIDELIKLRKLKGLNRDYDRLRAASIRHQFIWHKQVFESIRKSPVLVGFHFLQLADTERYENANGLLDCFDDLKPEVDVAGYAKFNSDAVLVADLPRRTFFDGERITIPVWLSNCTDWLAGEGTLTWRLASNGSKAVAMGGRLDRVNLPPGLSRLATVTLTLPAVAAAQAMTLSVQLKLARGRTVANEWNLWLYPDRPAELAIRRATLAMDGLNLVKRYPQLAGAGGRRHERLLIADRFSEAVFDQLARGGDVLMLYRVPETRDRSARRERYYLPATWDRFKAVIWDRGHNLGGFLRPHPAVAAFPTDGFLDFQFAGLIDDSDKLSLDGFPVPVAPIVQGVDKAVRDRYDVFTFKLRELQPDWTMRKFAYLFDLRVGRGRLMVSGFNFTGLESGRPEAAAMFESLAACVAGSAWQPRAKIAVADLKAYLAGMGRRPRIKERMMTQYWQLDDAPLESAQYWKDAEAWIRRR